MTAYVVGVITLLLAAYLPCRSALVPFNPPTSRGIEPTLPLVPWPGTESQSQGHRHTLISEYCNPLGNTSK
jgi:hypothetical protein